MSYHGRRKHFPETQRDEEVLPRWAQRRLIHLRAERDGLTVRVQKQIEQILKLEEVQGQMTRLEDRVTELETVEGWVREGRDLLQRLSLREEPLT